jgi:phage/plasmid-like protein (TIGR03299 family)
MSHEVETMAWAHEVPWHGLGVQVSGDLSPEEMLVAAGIDWEVELRDILVDGGGKIPGHQALVRKTDGKVYDIVGQRWKPVQNREAFQFFNEIARAGGAKMETAGALHGGQTVWGLARLGADFKLPGNDVVRNYVLMASHHKLGKATLAKLTNVRVVCANTMASALAGDAQWERRFSHVTEFDPALAVETFSVAREQVREFEKNVRLLKKLKITTDGAVRILAPVYQAHSKEDLPIDELVQDYGKLNPTMKSILECNKEAPGADEGTGWGLLNAVTYFHDHGQRREQDNRLASSWFGKSASRKEAVFASLLEMAQP